MKKTFIAVSIIGLTLLSNYAIANSSTTATKVAVPAKKTELKSSAVAGAFSTRATLRDGWSIHGFNRIGQADNVSVLAYGAQLRYKTYGVKNYFSHTCQLDARKVTRIAVTMGGITKTITVTSNGKINHDGTLVFYRAHTNEVLLPSHGFDNRHNTVAGTLGKPGELVRAEITVPNGKHVMFIGSVVDKNSPTANGSLCNH